MFSRLDMKSFLHLWILQLAADQNAQCTRV